MKEAVRALGLGVALSAMVWGVGCAQGGSTDGNGFGGDLEASAGVDGTTSENDARTGPGDDSAPPHDDATLGDDAGDDSAVSGDDDATVGGDDASTSGDGGETTTDAGIDSTVPAGDAGHDAGTGSGVDAGVDAGHDAGVDAGSPAGQDAGHDAGIDAGQDAGVDAGHDAAVPVTIATGGACDGNLTCTSGDICVGGGEADGGGFVCHQVCTSDSNCTQAPVASGTTSEPNNGPHCVISITNANPAETVCSVPCNPVTAAGATGCADGFACVDEGTADIDELTDCEPAGLVAVNKTCTNATLATSCGAGLTCVLSGGGTNGTCRTVCRVGKNSDCPTQTTCQTFTGVANEMFGFCE